MRRSLRRTVLTTLTMALAIFIFTVLVSVPASMNRIIADASTTLRLVVNNRTAPWYDLPGRYCTEIREMPGCAACVAITGWFGTYRDVTDNVFVTSAGGEISQVFPDYALSAEQREATRKDRRAAVLGEVLMQKHGWKIGDQITLHGQPPGPRELTFIIVGTLKSKHYPNTFLIRRDYLLEAEKAATGHDSDIAWQLIVRADSAEHLPMLAKEIDDRFRNSDYETRTITESQALSSGLSALGNVRGIIFSLCAIVILTVLLIAANSTAMMVRERIGEVAIMRALGFTRGSVAAILFGECAAIGAVGGAMGAGLAYWMFSGGVTLGAVLNGVGALWVSGDQAIGAIIISIAVAIVSGLIPILGAMRIAPALAFRKVV